MMRLLRRLFGGLEADMNEEMRAHLDQAAERLVARGLSPEEARVTARREFGNVTTIEDDARDARGKRWLESFAGDLRFAFRYFARKPLTTATIIIVLALGIGVNTALVSAIQAFTMRPAPAVPKNDAHVRIWGLEQPQKGATWRGRDFTLPELTDLAARAETFSAVAGWTTLDVVSDRHDGSGPRVLRAEFVTPNFFGALGVPMTSGPGFSASAQDGPDLSVVIAASVAEELFEDPAGAIGQTLHLNDTPLRIVGVAPPRFQGAVPAPGRPELWIPLSARADIGHTAQQALADSALLSLFAKLAPGVTIEQATALARSVATRERAGDAAEPGVVRTAEVVTMRGAPPTTAPDDPLVVYTVFGMIAMLILLVACTNVSSLLVAAAVGRRHEIAVRLSLGASRGRILRQLLTESALLAVAGGAGGLLLFWWLTKLISALPLNVEIAPDVLTVAFTLVFAIGTGLLFGLSPAFHAIRSGVATALRDSGTGATRRSRLQRVFVIAQIVFSQPLLVILALLLVVAVGQREQFPGEHVSRRIVASRFRPLDRPVRTCSVAAGCEFVQPVARPQGRGAVAELAERVAALSGVELVVPEAQAFAVRNVTTHPDERGVGPRAHDVIRVHVEGTYPGYFGALEVPIILGRDVALADSAGDDYRIVIGSDFARELWGDANPIGRRLGSTDWKSGARDSITMVVVGVYDASVPTTRGVDNRVYTAHYKQWRRDALLIRTRGPAQAVVPSLRTFVRAQMPDLPVLSIETLYDVGQRNETESFQLAAAAAAAGALALLLASIGLYAVVSLAVGQRRREIGIRIALGGKPYEVAASFFRSGVRLSVLGLLIGLPVSVLGLKLVISFVIAPRMNFPLVGVGIALVVLVVAATATWLPARKAATVDPSLALRVD